MPAGGRAGRRRSPRPWLRPPSDGDGNRAIRGRAIAELAVEVVAPAVSCPVAREPARMAGVPRRAWIWPRAENAARGERAKGEAAGDRNRDQAGGRGRTVAELPVAVSAPAVGCPSGREAAAVNRTRDNGAEAQPAGDGQGCRARCGGAGAELTVVVVAPAVGCAGAREPTRVGFLDRPVYAVANEEAAARGDGAKAETPGDRNRCQAGCRGKRAVPELPVVIVAPAVGRPGAGEPAGVTAVGGGGSEAQAPGDSNRNRAVRGRPVAE